MSLINENKLLEKEIKELKTERTRLVNRHSSLKFTHKEITRVSKKNRDEMYEAKKELVELRRKTKSIIVLILGENSFYKNLKKLNEIASEL